MRSTPFSSKVFDLDPKGSACSEEDGDSDDRREWLDSETERSRWYCEAIVADSCRWT